MADLNALTAKADKLLRDHRKKLIQLNRDGRISATRRDELIAEAIVEAREQVQALQADIQAAGQALTKAKPTKPSTAPQDVAARDAAWARVEKQLTQDRQDLASTLTEIAASAAEAEDTATLDALRQHLPAFINAGNRGESAQSKATMLTGLQKQIDLAVQPHLPESQRVHVAASNDAGKDSACLTLLQHAVVQGIADDEREVVLPGFDGTTVNVPSLRALGATDA